MAEAGTQITTTVKPWYKSWTVWYNVLTTAADVGATAAGVPIPISPKKIQLFNAGINILLRLFKSKHPLNTNPNPDGGNST